MSKLLNFIDSLASLRLAPVSSDMNIVQDILANELPFTVHEYDSGSEQGGWIVPQEWGVMKAEIRKDGELVYDGKAHPLGVTGYSRSFIGDIDFTELKKHLYYSDIIPEALIYYYRNFYRNWEKEWGFSIPKTLFNQLSSGIYSVDLQTYHKPGKLKVFDYFIKGESSKTITLLAHNCHAGQANDDITGVAVGIEVMKALSQVETYYSYRLLVAPEQFGSIFYLGDLPPNQISDFHSAIYLEMLGNDNRLALQDSYTGEAEIDLVASHYFDNNFPDYYHDGFRKIIGNDETVWEAPGYEIPCISISRADPLDAGSPYPEYHTSHDTIEILSEDRLFESIEAILGICNILERNKRIVRQFSGHLCLSNPKYNLYAKPNDPSIVEARTEYDDRWFQMVMNLARRLSDRPTVLDLSLEFGLPFDDVAIYINRYYEKGLVSYEN